MTIYLTDDAFSVKAKRFNKMFTSILALFFLLRIANKSHFYAPSFQTSFTVAWILYVTYYYDAFDIFCRSFVSSIRVQGG